MKIDEALLQFVWKFQLFDKTALTTTEGEQVVIYKQGLHNHDSGPDFTEARIKVNDLEWSGNVEIHLSENEWYNHKHHNDAAYNNVILHVVLFEGDYVAANRTGAAIPTLNLQGRVHESVFEQLSEMQRTQNWIACESLLNNVSDFDWLAWKERLIVERLEQRVRELDHIFAEAGGDWEKLIIRQLLKYFGLNVNKHAFQRLADVLNYTALQKSNDNLAKLEAILFGQAGFLDGSFKESYPKNLKREFFYLAELFDLDSISASEWKYARLRPPNFPTIRIAQLTAFLHQHPNFDRLFFEESTIDKIYTAFRVSTSKYWNTHFRFDKESEEKPKLIGKASVDVLIINVIAPIRYYKGHLQQNEALKHSAIVLLESLRPETNNITKGWKNLGIHMQNSADSQALIHLKSQYCEQFDCLNCNIGSRILSKN